LAFVIQHATCAEDGDFEHYLLKLEAFDGGFEKEELEDAPESRIG